MGLARDSIYAPPITVRTSNTEEEQLLVGILDQLRLMNLYLSRSVGEELTLDELEE